MQEDMYVPTKRSYSYWIIEVFRPIELQLFERHFDVDAIKVKRIF